MPASSGTRIDTLTSLRFFAAVAIVLHHMADFGWVSFGPDAPPLDNGVSFFFVLSGFVMYLVYGEMEDGASRRSFLVARVARIYPLHWLTFVLLFIMLNGDPSQFGTQENSIPSGVLNLALLQAWVPILSFFGSFNGASWTISAEMFFYVAFVFLTVRFKRSWYYKLPASLLLVATMCWLSDNLGIEPDSVPLNEVSVAGLIYINPLTRLGEFVMGMCVALIYTKLIPHRLPNGILATLIELATITIFVMNTLAVPVISFWVFDHLSPAAGVWFYHGGALAPSTSLLILVFSLESGAISRILLLKPFVLFGEISFSIYLIHQILLRSFAVHHDWFDALPLAGTIALYCAVLLISSAVAWRYFEVPARDWLRRTYARRTKRSAT